MCFLYILPWLRKNVFKRILQRSVRIGFWFWMFRSCSWSVPGLSPAGLLLVLCLALVHQIMPGGGASMGSLWWSVPDRLAVPGAVLRWGKGIKGMYDKSEIASNPDRFEPEKSEKNRRNLRLIQTCDFFYFVHFVYNSL